jgi:hypothetical protein
LTRDILERAFDKTKELEEKQMKKLKIASALGNACGWTAAMALDALAIWLILNFMVGVSVSYMAVFGGTLLFVLTLAKIRVFSK